MFYTVYLNPTIDKTMYLHEFFPGKTNRPYSVVEDGAGKAINVAVVLKELGADVSCFGLLPGADEQIIQTRLDDYGVPYEFLEIGGKARVNIKIFDDSSKTVTEINERGGPVAEEKLKLIESKIKLAAKHSDMIFLTGSLPDGCDPSFYAHLISALAEKGVRCVLDASGEPLRLGIRAKPYFIKPNKDELCALFGLSDPSVDEIALAAAKLVKSGIPYVMVSLGGEGAMIADGREVLFAKPLETLIRSTVGAGDSMVAAAAFQLDNNMETALKSGVAAASASMLREGTRMMTYADYERLLEEVEVKKII